MALVDYIRYAMIFCSRHSTQHVYLIRQCQRVVAQYRSHSADHIQLGRALDVNFFCGTSP